MAATIAAMDAGGVDRALISAWVAPGRVMISNDEVHAFVAEYPDRLIGVGSVDLSKPVQAVAEIRRCVDELGFRAIRVLPWLWERPPTDPLFYPVYTACCELGVPFCTQIGHTGPLMPSEPGRPIHLDRVALDFPELVIVGGQGGDEQTDGDHGAQAVGQQMGRSPRNDEHGDDQNAADAFESGYGGRGHQRHQHVGPGVAAAGAGMGDQEGQQQQ